MAQRSTVRGAEQLNANLSRLSVVPTGAALEDVLRGALEPLAHEVAARAPRPSLRRGVAIATTSRRSRFQRVLWVSFRRSMAMRIAHLVEFGTAPHSLARGSSRRKGIGQDRPPFHPGTPAEPFMRPAFEAKKDDVLIAARRGFWGLILGAVRMR